MKVVAVNIHLTTMLAGIGLIVFGTGVTAIWGHGLEHNPSRFQHLEESGIPDAYRGLLNPLPATAEHLASGQRLYEENCGLCHGASGDGKGEAAEGLEPPPAVINAMYGQPMAGMDLDSPGANETHLMHGVEHHHPGMTHAEAMGGLNLDAYTFWAISEGGDMFGSAMPATKEYLSEQERWEILLYVANGFSTEPPDGAE